MNARDKIYRDAGLPVPQSQKGGEHAAQLRRDQAQVVEVHCDGEDKFVVIQTPDGEQVSLREGDLFPAGEKAAGDDFEFTPGDPHADLASVDPNIDEGYREEDVEALGGEAATAV